MTAATWWQDPIAAAALRAIATRNGGSPLVWSQEFQQQLSGSAGLHPSGFAMAEHKGRVPEFCRAGAKSGNPQPDHGARSDSRRIQRNGGTNPRS